MNAHSLLNLRKTFVVQLTQLEVQTFAAIDTVESEEEQNMLTDEFLQISSEAENTDSGTFLEE